MNPRDRVALYGCLAFLIYIGAELAYICDKIYYGWPGGAK